MKYASLDKMIAIVAVAFQGDFDKGGKPYILHLMRVANKMPKHDYKAQMVAWGHDLMEDKPDWTPVRLRDEGFHPKVIGALMLLDHVKGYPYMSYVEALASDPLARMVKMADLEDNSDITRLKGVSDKDLARLAKYNKAYAFLRDYVDA